MHTPAFCRVESISETAVYRASSGRLAPLLEVTTSVDLLYIIDFNLAPPSLIIMHCVVRGLGVSCPGAVGTQSLRTWKSLEPWLGPVRPVTASKCGRCAVVNCSIATQTAPPLCLRLAQDINHYNRTKMKKKPT